MEQQNISPELQKAAEEYATTVRSFGFARATKDFIAGALWQRNSVWHNASEEPFGQVEESKEYIVLYATIPHFAYGANKTHIHDWNKVIKWCCLSDILPTTNKDN